MNCYLHPSHHHGRDTTPWQPPIRILGNAAYPDPRETGWPSGHHVWAPGIIHNQHAGGQCTFHSVSAQLEWVWVHWKPSRANWGSRHVAWWHWQMAPIYFPQAHPRARGGYTYMLVLLGLREPFPKVAKTTTSWFHKTKFGIWKLSLQSEKPVALHQRAAYSKFEHSHQVFLFTLLESNNGFQKS